MFGGQHTEEGEKYLYETPDVYEEVLLWNVFFLMRTKLGGIEKIHKVDGR